MVDSSGFFQPVVDSSGHSYYFNKLEQLGTKKKEPNEATGENAGAVEPFEVLRKRARAKFISSKLAVRLSNLDSPLRKSYVATFFCANALHQNGTKITSNYCGHRWCTVCNRIRTAKLIKGYEGVMSELPDLRFVTLTVPNVPGYHLQETIDRMLSVFTSIQGTFKKRKQRGLQSWQLVGLRKIECTYNPKTNEFHPHFHFVISGKEAAKGLISEWLERVDTANQDAQDMRKTRAGSEKELFKYLVKLPTKIDGKSVMFLEPLDTIFQAMRGRRVFQPIGIKKDVSEEIENLQSVEVTGIAPVDEITYWPWENNDWVNHETGEALTGYTPSEKALNQVENIFLNVDEYRGNGASIEPFEVAKVPVFGSIPGLEKHRENVLNGMAVF